MRPRQPAGRQHDGAFDTIGDTVIRRFPDDAEAAAFVQLYRRIGDPKHRACLRWFVFELANET